MKLVTTEPAINEKYDAEVLRGLWAGVSLGGRCVGVCCLGHTSLTSLSASPEDPHAILGLSFYTLGQTRVFRGPGDPLGGQHPDERARSGCHPAHV